MARLHAELREVCPDGAETLTITRRLNLVGAVDIVIDYYHAVHLGLAAMAGQFGATYVIPILYVPLLMITHVTALYGLVRRPQPRSVRAFAGDPSPV